MHRVTNGTSVPKSVDSPDLLPNFKVLRSKKLIEWLDYTEQAMQGLRRWANCLTAWENEIPSDDDFMAAVQEMSELGLLEWMDEIPAFLDALRNLVTGAVYSSLSESDGDEPDIFKVFEELAKGGA